MKRILSVAALFGGVRLEYLQGLKSLGYNVKTTDLVVNMKTTA